MKLSPFTSPACTCCAGGTVFLILGEQMIDGFHPSAFAMLAKSISDFVNSFRAFPLFMSQFMREMHWPPAGFTVLTN